MAQGVIKSTRLTEANVAIGTFTISSGNYYVQNLNVNVQKSGLRLISVIAVTADHIGTPIATSCSKTDENKVVVSVFTYDRKPATSDITDTYTFRGLYQQL